MDLGQVLALGLGLGFVFGWVVGWVQQSPSHSQKELVKEKENWLQLDSRKAQERSLAALGQKEE
jgi:hypothetical protein